MGSDCISSWSLLIFLFGIVQSSNSSWAAPIVCVPKKDKSIRLCVDYRGLNSQTIFDPQPMPKIDEIINKLGKAKYISKLDLTKGYWQIPLSEKAKEESAFVTPFGHYQFKVLPFGMINSAASFVRLMKIVERYWRVRWFVYWRYYYFQRYMAFALGSFMQSTNGSEKSTFNC